MTNLPASLVDLLRIRAAEQPHELVYRFLTDGEQAEVSLTFYELDQLARAVGARLRSVAKIGDRALLLFPPGLDFITAFWGCLYAGVMAIPTYPPHPVRIKKSLPIVQRIVADAQPAVALMSTSLLEGIQSQKEIAAVFAGMHLVATDRPRREDWAKDWNAPPLDHQSIAFLQYTSGSTTTPKGVVLSNGNLLHNMQLIAKCFGVTPETHGVIWLPPYHDMGLIGGILQPVFSAVSATLLSHMMFLQRPLRWLQAISRFGADISGAPNFAYDLCVRKIRPEQLSGLDLSCWRVAFNGAEPVYHKTLQRFAAHFAPCGFRPEAFLPCYGQAESTLLITGTPGSQPPRIQNLAAAALEEDRVEIATDATPQVRTLVSCGVNLSDQQIRIVHPETMEPCAPDQVGEIWLRGPCVAQGYWNKPEETDLTFKNHLPGETGAYLRSGDLGFWYQGELYITGRCKNLIIVAGKNHYANDIEKTIEHAHPAIYAGGCAVFAVEQEAQDEVIVVAEVNHRKITQEDAIKLAIRQAVATQHGLPVADIRLTFPGGIPRTTSGKIRHFLCKKNYVSGNLKEITVV